LYEETVFFLAGGQTMKNKYGNKLDLCEVTTVKDKKQVAQNET
jgi:hypothetical protein